MSKEQKSTILVPTDFTEVGNIAVKHASLLASGIGYSVTVLHIINSKTKDMLKKKGLTMASIDETLAEIANNLRQTYNIEVDYLSRQGNIYSTINEIATEIGAGMVVIGTHGKFGLQKILGSNVLKVVTNAPVPVVVSQNINPDHVCRNMVLPLDLTEHSRQKFKWAVYIATRTGAKVHVVCESATDQFLKNRLVQKQAQVEKILAENKIDFDIYLTSKMKGSFAKKILSVAKEVNADLLMIMTTPDQIIPGFILAPGDDKLLFNSLKIPVMCVNPKDLGIQILGM